ncbi:hypothetical protein DV735_g1888, partial [Chaetothyriales sp. CBS 134920]
MLSDPVTSAHASLVSIDPAIASQITATSASTSSCPHSHSRNNSNPTKGVKKAPATLPPGRGHARNQSAPLHYSGSHKRSNSLRRAKNSTEVLRQHATRPGKRPPPLEHSQDSRSGRSFTVGSVGTGGLLYLRPSVQQNSSPQSLFALQMPLTAPPDLSTTAADGNVGRSIRSQSPPRAGASVSPARSPKKRMRRPTAETIRSRQGRSQSFSTVDEQCHTVNGTRTRIMKVVINRSSEEQQPRPSQDAVSEVAELPALAMPTLQVSIPHYRIGTPHFSDHGTAMLRTSYADTTLDAADPTQGQDQAEKRQKGPPPSHAKAFARMVSGETPAFWRGSHVQKPRPTTTSSTSAQTDSTIREPIHPEIFDELAGMYDDPSVVRYSQNVREITAATPARIIAQISSESFMDYELVSDFFLTFRSYISSMAVLDLLLARLRWAIDRQEDDGRIIRVRTFAALRHWILNYFHDDFVPDRKLRTRFCNEINRMYADVASRRSNGTSDLKVLRDLKRCWNGRCSMFWNPDYFVSDLDQDGDIQPGGFDDDAFISADHLTSPLASPRPMARRPSTSGWTEPAPSPIHDVQQQNHGSPGKQASVLSSSSIQAKSCSIAKALLRPHNDTSPTAPASHPVPVLLRREKAPASLHVQTTTHRRGGGSIDSDREPTPRDADLELALLAYPSSVIRGAAFSPRAPFVQIASSPTLSTFPKYQANAPDVRNGRSTASPTSAQNGAAVKTILGSLRRVLAGRHAHSDVALGPVSGPLPLQEPQRLPRTALPLNMSKSYDELRARGHAPSKAQVRIDLLCAQALHNHGRVFPTSRAVGVAELGQEVPSPVVISPTPRQFNPSSPSMHASKGRLRSQTTVTTQSGNIVIVNDTGISVPTMSGAIGPLAQPHVDWQAQTPGLDQISGFEVPQPRDDDKPGPTSTLRSSDLLTADELAVAQPAPVDNSGPPFAQAASPDSSGPSRTQQTASSVTESSARLRNVKSFQSSTQAEPSMMTVTSPSTADDDVEGTTPEDEIKMHAPALRRKPGGDLRMAENVHDLSRDNHHTSFDTITTGPGSPISFTARGGAEGEKEQGKMLDKKVSMIHTHSSQHLRPSFQAAVAGLIGMPDEDDGGLEVALMKLEGRYEKKSPPLDQHPVDAMRQMPDVVAGMPVAQPMAEPVQQAAQDVASSRASSILGLPLTARASSDQYDDHPLSQQTSEPQSVPKTSSDPVRRQPGFDNESDTLPARVAVPRTSGLDEARQDSGHDTAESFLLDEGENLSDLSSEISVDVIRDHSDTDKSIQPMIAAPGTALSGLEIPSHPLTHASIINLAPSPVDRTERVPIADARNGAREAIFQPTNMAGVPAHLPFILGCDSQVLAQQMTLIEKSALTEIEWFDLVDMRWDNTSSNVLDWAEYLARGNVRGVDLVIARFNLVSRWVRSEIVLTQDADERAQVIAKLIHVAAHARRLRNYTTMVQLTIGLTSSDVTRLAKTWDKVSGPDRSLLKNMERLVQPLRNFHHLRAEIEGSDFSDGCIPFLGLYVHDLTYNAQKPAQVASNHGDEPLINFERYRTTAAIVKNLLRLIDASVRYNFEPVKGVIDRCLWMTALTDDKIWQMSKALEDVPADGVVGEVAVLITGLAPRLVRPLHPSAPMDAHAPDRAPAASPPPPQPLPDDLPTSLDDRRPWQAGDGYRRETEIYDGWQGSSQFITAPTPAQPLAFDLHLDTPVYDDAETFARIQDSDTRLMEMVAAQALHRQDSSTGEDEDAIANDDRLTDAAKSETLQKSLNMAASNGDVARVKRLVGGKAKIYVDVNLADEEGTVPLIYASCFGHTEVVAALLDAGADVDKQDANQWSALMWAMTNRHKAIAKLLLDHGANPDIRSSSGGTAYDFVQPGSEFSHYLHENGYRFGSGLAGVDDFYRSGFDADRLEEEYAETEMKRRQLMHESAVNLEVDLGSLGFGEQPESPTALEADEEEFIWDRCVGDQMFVFQDGQLGPILDMIITNMTPRRSPSQKPVPANLVFLMARYAHYHMTASLLDKVLASALDRITSIIERHQWDMTMLAFWISNQTLLLHYLKKDAGLVQATTRYQAELAELINETFILIIRDAERRLNRIIDVAMLDHETIPGFDDIEFQGEWKVFKSKKQTVEDPPEKRFRPPSPKRRAQISPRNVTSLLSSTLFVLDLYDVHSVITAQILAQILYWIGAELFNRVMSTRRYLSRTKAMQIRMNVSQIEDWARANNRQPQHYDNGSTMSLGEDTVTAARRYLAPVIQLLQWLQCFTSLGEDHESLINTLTQLQKLTPAMLIRAVKSYRAEVGEKSLPKQHMKFLGKLQRGEAVLVRRPLSQDMARAETPVPQQQQQGTTNGKSEAPTPSTPTKTQQPQPQQSSPESFDPDPGGTPPLGAHGSMVTLDQALMLPFSLPTSTDMLISYGAGIGGMNRERAAKYIPTVPVEIVESLLGRKGEDETPTA